MVNIFNRHRLNSSVRDYRLSTCACLNEWLDSHLVRDAGSCGDSQMYGATRVSNGLPYDRDWYDNGPYCNSDQVRAWTTGGHVGSAVTSHLARVLLHSTASETMVAKFSGKWLSVSPAKGYRDIATPSPTDSEFSTSSKGSISASSSATSVPEVSTPKSTLFGTICVGGSGLLESENRL